MERAEFAVGGVWRYRRYIDAQRGASSPAAERKGKTTGNKQQALYEKKENLESDVANMKFDAGAG